MEGAEGLAGIAPNPVHTRWLTDSWVLLAVAPDGGRREQLTRNDISEFEPVASPDGARIAFVRDGGLTGHSPFPAGAPPACSAGRESDRFRGLQRAHALCDQQDPEAEAKGDLNPSGSSPPAIRASAGM
jgi:hypothetical protein